MRNRAELLVYYKGNIEINHGDASTFYSTEITVRWRFCTYL